MNLENGGFLIHLAPYSGISNTFKLEFKGGQFENLNFQETSQLFLIGSNLENPILIQDYTFTNITNAYIDLRAGDKTDKNKPSKTIISSSTFSNISTVYDTLLKVSENSELTVLNSTFTHCINEGKGGVIQGGYKETKILINGC